MIYIIISTDELVEFIREHPFVIIEFKASWCASCARIAPHYQNFASKYVSMKFGSIDVEYVGQDKLDKLHINLNLGAIPSFYMYRNGLFLDRLISGSPTRLENFIDIYYIGEISSDSNFVSPLTSSYYSSSSSTHSSSSYFSSSQSNNSLKSFFVGDDSASSDIMPKCTKCSQYGHRSRECYIDMEKTEQEKLPPIEKQKKEKIICSNCGKVHPAWKLKCMKNSETKKITNSSSNSSFLTLKEFRKERHLTSLSENDPLKTSKTLPKIATSYEKLSGNTSTNASRENLAESNMGSNSKLNIIKAEKKHVTWNLIPLVKETKQQDQDLIKELLTKLSKLEMDNKKRQDVYLTVKKQKEIINFLKEKVEILTDENNSLKRSKSAELVRSSKK